MKKKNIVFHNGTFYKKTENDFFCSYKELDPAEVNIPEEDISCSWKGPLIPFDLWRELIAWCEITQEKFKSEALAFLYLDDKEGWKIWYPPQITRGMTVGVDQDSPQYNPQRKLLGDALQMGTLHHHCTSSAFASGTDKADEIDRDGLHFTIGNLDKNTYDIHMRICVNNTCWDCEPTDFIEVHESLDHVPEKYRQRIHADMISEASEPAVLKTFEKIFKEALKNVKKPTYTPPDYGGIGGRHQSYIWDEWENDHLPANNKSKQQVSDIELVDEYIRNGGASMITELDWGAVREDILSKFNEAPRGSVDEIKALMLALEVAPLSIMGDTWKEIIKDAELPKRTTIPMAKDLFEQWIRAQS